MKFVVIGASAAGVNAVQKLRERKPDDEIVLISKDREIYSRCILYRYLEGARTLEELNFAGFDFIVSGRGKIWWDSGICRMLSLLKKDYRMYKISFPTIKI